MIHDAEINKITLDSLMDFSYLHFIMADHGSI